mgnify:CR=1 FL=1
MTEKTLPDLTVRTHELHDAAFKVAASDMAYQAATGSPAQSRAYLGQMEKQLREVRGQCTQVARAIRAHRAGR